MSKSKKNVVSPENIINSHGADALRLFILSDSPPDKNRSWSTSGIDGASRYINRLWKTGLTLSKMKPSSLNASNIALSNITKLRHKTIKECKIEMEKFGFNKVIAQTRALHNAIDALGYDTQNYYELISGFEAIIQILTPFIPHITHELSEILDIDITKYPTFDEKLTQDDIINIGVQINGKFRGEIKVSADCDKENCLKIAQTQENIKKYLTSDINYDKVVFIPNKILNIITYSIAKEEQV